MSRQQSHPSESVSIDDVVTLLEATLPTERAAVVLSTEVREVARGVLEATASSTHDRTIVALAALTLASRRTGRVELTPEEVATAVGVNRERVVEADEQLVAELSPPAAERDRTAVRRRLIVATELLAAAERDRLCGFYAPGSTLADAAPDLLARADRHCADDDCTDDIDLGLWDDGGLTVAELQAHVDRLEADLELARLGTELYAAVHTR